MQLNRCPVCKTRNSLLAVAQDEAQKELMTILVKLDVLQGAALLSYLSLFASDKRDLSNDKALTLTREVMKLSAWPLLAVAMSETVESLQGRQEKPLKNHNYLKQVLQSVEQRQVVQVVDVVTPPGQLPTAPKSATAQALLALQNGKGGTHE